MATDPVFVQAATIATGASLSPSITLTLTAGNIVNFMSSVAAGRTVTAISDDKGNTYSIIQNATGGSMGSHICRAVITTGGSTTITATLSGTGTPTWAATAVEWSNCDTTTPDDVSSSLSTAAETNTVVYAAPASTINLAANTCAVCCVRSNNADTHTASTGFTKIESGSLVYYFGYGVFTAGSTGERGGFTKASSNRTSLGTIASFNGAPSGGGSSLAGQLLLLGCGA